MEARVLRACSRDFWAKDRCYKTPFDRDQVSCGKRYLQRPFQLMGGRLKEWKDLRWKRGSRGNRSEARRIYSRNGK